jgi:hypothetical protein
VSDLGLSLGHHRDDDEEHEDPEDRHMGSEDDEIFWSDECRSS